MPTEGLSQSCAKHFGSPSAASTLVFVLLSKSNHGLYNLKIPNMYPLTPVTSDCLQHTFVGSQRDQRAARLIYIQLQARALLRSPFYVLQLFLLFLIFFFVVFLVFFFFFASLSPVGLCVSSLLFRLFLARLLLFAVLCADLSTCCS